MKPYLKTFSKLGKAYTKYTAMIALCGSTLYSPSLYATNAPITATSSYGFLQSLGINTHMWEAWGGVSYQNVALTESELKYIGIKHARDCFNDPNTIASSERKLYNDIGVQYDIWVRGVTYTQEIAYVKANADMLTQIEGANEPDNFTTSFTTTAGVLSGVAAGVAEQKQLYTDIKATPATSGLVINSLTLVNPINTPQVGNVSSYVTNVAAHIYPQWGGDNGGWIYPYLQYALAQYGKIAPGKSYTITEGGYWTQPSPTGVPEVIQAKYTLDYYFDAFKMGVGSTYLYELSDELPDATGANMEMHFGLFHYDGTPKTAATALHNVTTLLADTQAPSSLGTLSYSLTGLPTTGYHQLFQKSDGTLVLAVWNDAKIWDNATLKTIAVDPTNVLLDLGQTVSSVKIYDPMIGLTPTKTMTSVAGFTVSVPDHPILIFITPQTTGTQTSAVTQSQTIINQTTPATVSVTAGKTFNLTYNWTAMPMDANYKVFVHIIDTKGNILVQDDHYPQGTNTMLWSGNVSYTDTLKVPLTVPAGTYRVVMGLYTPVVPYPGQSLSMGASVTQYNVDQYQTGTVSVLSP